ncbi:MAG: S8 family serine peptidase, partial [Candidatus Eisenbacteria bacterium]|nr:S8 family serine peptidase [Candidatus Latescibacterota bacterium]MBD3301071.1 S8 family serine peptidase [Candidatus Eisenbacteria bacterium]
VTTDAWLAGGIAHAYQHGADVLSNSWRSGASDQIHAAIRDAIAFGRGGLGAIVVFAAGNDWNHAPFYPSLYPETICVAATSPCDSIKSPTSCDGEHWWGSSHGPGVDVAAPGVLIPTTDIQGGDGYTGGDYFLTFNGTSSATPQVAGLAALLVCQYPHWQGMEIRARIEQTCDKIGGYAYDATTGISDELGHGRINLYRALSGKPQVELGPAPDYPSVYRDEGDAESPYPTAHHGSAAYEWLGEEYSPEKNEDDPEDPDGIGNLSGRDAFDDGVRFHPPYVPQDLGTIDVTVSVEDPMSSRYTGTPNSLRINVWFDWESDGSWDQPHDWVIQNHRVDPAAWGGARTKVVTLQFPVPDTDIDWHIQNDQDGEFLNVRTRLSYDEDLQEAPQEAKFGEVEDDRFVNFVEMFDVGPGYMNTVAQGCDPWDWVDGQAFWQPNPCPAPFRPDGGTNGYMTNAIYNPIYAGDADDGLRTPSFDFTEMTEAFVLFEHSAVEVITGRLVVYVDGVLDSTLMVFNNIPTTPPACGIVYPEGFDLNDYCGDGFDDVVLAFEAFHDEACGTQPPTYQDWFIDNVVVVAQDRIAPETVNVNVTPTAVETADVDWISTGDDAAERQAQLYNIRYGPETIDGSNWRHAMWLREDMTGALPIPQPPGAQERISVQRLSPGLHHFSIRTLDEVTNIAAIADGGQNQPPDQTAPDSLIAVEGDLLEFDVTATDPDLDPLFLFATQRPSSSTYVDNGDGTATFRWTPDIGDAGEVDVTVVARDPNGANDTDTINIIVLPQVAPDYEDHDAGAYLFSVTDQGVLGFLDATQTDGSGFVYPKNGGLNHLYIGGLWVARSDAYVANRDYDADPEKEWRVSADPLGSVMVGPHDDSDQDISSIFTDLYDPNGLGLRVQQESWAYSNATDDDFVIVRYLISNVSDQDLTDLHAGLYLDLDLRTEGGDDTGSTDAGRELAYLTDPSDIHVGARRLRPATGALPMSNLTLVHNPTYVYPLEYVSDADKYAFLTAADQAHVLTDGPTPDDYSLLVALGPFDLAKNDTREIAFAIVAGSSIGAFEQNADRAQIVYDGIPSEAPDLPGEAGVTRLMPSMPNPFRLDTAVRFQLAREAPLSVDVFDVTGRKVRNLASGPHSAGAHSIRWNRRDDADRKVGSGVYFIRMITPGTEESRRVVILK